MKSVLPDISQLVMEFLEGGTLDQAVKSFNFTEPQIAYVAKQVIVPL